MTRTSLNAVPVGAPLSGLNLGRVVPAAHTHALSGTQSLHGSVR